MEFQMSELKKLVLAGLSYSNAPGGGGGGGAGGGTGAVADGDGGNPDQPGSHVGNARHMVEFLEHLAPEHLGPPPPPAAAQAKIPLPKRIHVTDPKIAAAEAARSASAPVALLENGGADGLQTAAGEAATAEVGGVWTRPHSHACVCVCVRACVSGWACVGVCGRGFTRRFKAQQPAGQPGRSRAWSHC